VTPPATSGAALVAVVTAQPDAPLARRVAAELRSLGVDVIVLKPPGEASPAGRAPLEQAARNVGAVAALRLVSSGEGKIEVWVADRVTGKAVVRELDAPGASDSDAAVAVAAVELLRASLMELHAPDAPHGEVPATPALEALALPQEPPPWTPRFGLSVAGGVELAGSSVGFAPDLGATLWLRLASRFGARLLGRTTLGASAVTTAAGDVDVSSQMFGATLGYDLADAASAWVPSVHLGVGAARVASTGAAAAPYVSGSAAGWYFTPLAGAGVGFAFVRGLRLRADALGAWAIPQATVRTPAGVAGRWGAPDVSLAVGLEVLWAP
jgi:hypothetical protein